MADYLTLSKSLVTVFVLLDIRLVPNELDKTMLSYLIFNNIPFKIIATKSDKMSKAAGDRALNAIAKHLNVPQNFIISSSSKDRQGIQKLLEYIDNAVEAYYAKN